MTTRERKRPVRVTGHVWCDKEGEVHVNSLNPYGYDLENHCKPEDHRPVYVWATPSEGEF